MQSKKHSLAEAITNTILGILISILLIRFVLPLFGVFITWEQNLITTGLFFVASTLRSYFVRRAFNYGLFS